MSIVHTKLGEALRIERENRKLNIADLASQLKISDSILEAIEQGSVESLPSEIYYNLFAKSYAEHLGIDFTRTMEAIREEVGEPEVPLNGVTGEGEAAPSSRPAPPSGKRPVIEPEEPATGGGKKLAGWIIVIVLVIAALAVSYKFLVLDGKKAGPETATINQSAPAAQNQPSGTQVTAAGEYVNGPFTMAMISRGQSWVTVLVDGESKVNREVNAGESIEMTANTSMVVSISEPLLLDVRINGRPVDLIDPRTKSIMRVIINHNTLANYLPKESDTTGSDTVQSPDSGQKVDTTR